MRDRDVTLNNVGLILNRVLQQKRETSLHRQTNRPTKVCSTCDVCM